MGLELQKRLEVQLEDSRSTKKLFEIAFVFELHFLHDAAKVYKLLIVTMLRGMFHSRIKEIHFFNTFYFKRYVNGIWRDLAKI